MIAFTDLVENKALEMFDSWHAKNDVDEEMCIELFRQDARRDLILSWAAHNPDAMEALVDGRAAVVPYGHGGGIHSETLMLLINKPNGYASCDTRLDTPQEKK